MSEPGSRPRLRYVPGLDGIRAVALLAVMAFHNFTWLPGGFYSVDTFFVLSGYLITSLLLSEWTERGTVRLGNFWAWRARRLLPAVFLLVAAIGIVAALWPSAFGAVDLLPNALATVFYGANWYFIYHHVGYFTAGATSPLLHTWTLAIEEQFYLVWPLVVLAVLRLGRGRGRGAGAGRQGRHGRPASPTRRIDALFGLCVAGAAGSALLMSALTPVGATTTRAYYGTDTRAQALLVGAALAVAFTRWDVLRSDRLRAPLAAVACLGAVGTGIAWATIPITSSLAFHGGFLLASLGTAAVIAGVVQAPRGPVALALSWAPLRALGRVTYGGYLWYWPVLLLMTAARTHTSGWLLFGERTAVTFGLAAASYHLLEMPIRRGRLPGWRALVAAPVGAGVALAAVAISTLVPVSASSAHAVTTGAATPSASAPGLADSLGSSNVAAMAGRSRPLKVLVVGDSIGGTLGVGLEQEAARYDIEMVDVGAPGCSVSMDELFRVLAYTVPPGAPCRDGDPGALLAKWRTWVDDFNPDVVVYVARGELFDQEVDGAWTDITQPAFAAYLSARFEAGIGVLGSKGAAVVLLTTPYYDSGRQPGGQLWPEDQPTRVAADNRVIRQVAAAGDRGAPQVHVFDFGALVSPGGHFDQDVDGVDLRCSDGVHFTAAGGRWVAPRLLPYLAGLAGAHAAAAPGGTWPGTPPPAVPRWWGEVPCG
jgi:peptidoglycan/LPS O-acetylase OafA/YrhL